MRFLLLLLLALPLVVSAHGGGLPSLEAVEGQYTIDIGYDRVPTAGEAVTFDLDLFLMGPPIDYAEFATVSMRVSKDGAELFNETVENDAANVPTMTVTFPEAAGYDIDVRFEDASRTLIAAHTFHLEVQTPTAGTMLKTLDGFHYAIAGGLFALSVGIAGYSLWQRFGKR